MLRTKDWRSLRSGTLSGPSTGNGLFRIIVKERRTAFPAPNTITKKIRLGAAVVVLPLYNPARLVAEIATADALSNGRLMLGVGAGYQPDEFERFGVDIKVTSIAQGSARR